MTSDKRHNHRSLNSLCSVKLGSFRTCVNYIISFFFILLLFPQKELISFPSDNSSQITNIFIRCKRQLQLLRSFFGSPSLQSGWRRGVMSDSLTAPQSDASDTWRRCRRWSTKPRVRRGVGIQLASRGKKKTKHESGSKRPLWGQMDLPPCSRCLMLFLCETETICTAEGGAFPF